MGGTDSARLNDSGLNMCYVSIVRRSISTLLLFGLLFLPCAGPAQSTPPDSKRAAEFLAESALGLKTLQTWYVEETGQWRSTGWWNAANALTMVVDYAKLNDSPDLRHV